jgi:hypothetical protein
MEQSLCQPMCRSCATCKQLFSRRCDYGRLRTLWAAALPLMCPSEATSCQKVSSNRPLHLSCAFSYLLGETLLPHLISSLCNCCAACRLVKYGAGTTVLVSPWVMHRDPQHWSQPEAFLPERWLDQLAAKPAMAELSNMGTNGAYLPFGAGPRNCIGTGSLPSMCSMRHCMPCMQVFLLILARVLGRCAIFDLSLLPARFCNDGGSGCPGQHVTGGQVSDSAGRGFSGC